MGIYTDYGRFAKARQFKDWCNAGAGIWFGFGTGSPEWDKIVTDADGKDKPNVPPSSPNLYSPIYRWFKSYKENHGVTPPATLAPQELSLLDLSYWGKEDGVLPSYEYVVTPPGDTLPPDTWTPSVCFKNQNDQLKYSNYTNKLYPDMGTEEWKIVSDNNPCFPVGYPSEWDGIINTYPGSSFDPNNEPTDPSQYQEFANNYHLYYGGTDMSLSGAFAGAPLGLLAFIQGSAHFVEPIDGETSGNSGLEGLKKFKYGNHYWRIVPDTEFSDYDGDAPLPHHVLLTVSVFPNELAQSSLVEMMLNVRQVSVFKFPDSLVRTLGLDLDPLPRSNQVLRREAINMVYSGKYGGGVYTTDLSLDRINIPFNSLYPMDPNDTNNPTIEMIINDYMTARKRDVQQTDRYGYIIGF